MTNEKEAQECAELLKAIGEKNRIRIIESLSEGAKNVSELASALKLEIVNVSHHLGVLKSVRLVKEKKLGRFKQYSLTPEYFNAEGEIPTLNLGWCHLVLGEK
ncbi:MAG: metalloregulator ArsR/SmtB family transcription factor [Zavarzinella sp.]